MLQHKNKKALKRELYVDFWFNATKGKQSGNGTRKRIGKWLTKLLS